MAIYSYYYCLFGLEFSRFKPNDRDISQLFLGKLMILADISIQFIGISRYRNWHEHFLLVKLVFLYTFSIGLVFSHNPQPSVSNKIAQAVTHFVRGEVAAKAANSFFEERFPPLFIRFPGTNICDSTTF